MNDRESSLLLLMLLIRRSQPAISSNLGEMRRLRPSTQSRVCRESGEYTRTPPKHTP
ncbi:hypothetical protein HMPREF9004_1643 [Schaalia cardiffensis F0333]|uniref:Uncharacterized protein n=1 Tax=Schaalia cardiffensis F0333 TaxID=888050 RepID=N6X9D0_9ACTO|nr:hypothetical protein HMPREF9004_1643 [Schaalia cardiffensis F0333]